MEAHGQGLNTKVEQEARKRVALADTSMKGEEGAISAVDTDTGSAFMGEILDKGYEVGVNAYSGKDLKEPVLVNTIVGFCLVEADNITIRVSSFCQMGDHGREAGVLSDKATRDKALLVVMEFVDGPGG